MAARKKKTNGTKLEPAMTDAFAHETADRPTVRVLPEGAQPLSELLPTYNTVRVYINETGEEQPGAAWLAFNSDKRIADCKDPRIGRMPVDKMRGHGARIIAPPKAALVRVPSSRNIVLMVEGLDSLASDRAGPWKPVGCYRLSTVAQLPDDHPVLPPSPSMPTEAVARCIQLHDRSTDEEMRNVWSPFNDELFRNTVAEAVAVKCALYRMPGSGSGVMWVAHHGFIWKCPGLVRKAGNRRPEVSDPTDEEKVAYLNARTVHATRSYR